MDLSALQSALALPASGRLSLGKGILGAGFDDLLDAGFDGGPLILGQARTVPGQGGDIVIDGVIGILGIADVPARARFALNASGAVLAEIAATMPPGWSFAESFPGMPGIVAPITPPDFSCNRARYQKVGAVKPRCGSLAKSVPPEAERSGAAAQTLEAPANPRRGTGQRKSPPCGAALAWRVPLPSGSCAMRGRAATPLPGMSGRMSDRRFSSPRSSEVRARSTSSPIWPDSCSAISLITASESAGCQGAISASKRKNSGAPRPRLLALISAMRALMPAE